MSIQSLVRKAIFSSFPSPSVTRLFSVSASRLLSVTSASGRQVHFATLTFLAMNPIGFRMINTVPEPTLHLLTPSLFLDRRDDRRRDDSPRRGGRDGSRDRRDSPPPRRSVSFPLDHSPCERSSSDPIISQGRRRSWRRPGPRLTLLGERLSGESDPSLRRMPDSQGGASFSTPPPPPLPPAVCVGRSGQGQAEIIHAKASCEG
jgi:hypothetical protein